MTINAPRIKHKLNEKLHGQLYGNYMLNLKNIFYGKAHYSLDIESRTL